MKKHNKNISFKQRRKDWIAKQSKPLKVSIFLKVFLVWYEPRAEGKLFPFRCTKLNPYNPLTWLVILGTWVVINIAFICYYSFQEMDVRNEFKLKKWG